MRQQTVDLLKLTVSFMDLCQTQVLNKKLDPKQYRELTAVKLEFIRNILGSPKTIAAIDDALMTKIKKVFSTDLLLDKSKENIADDGGSASCDHVSPTK